MVFHGVAAAKASGIGTSAAPSLRLWLPRLMSH